MGKYFEAAELEPEIRKLLIEEFGSIQNAKSNMDIFAKHLPVKLQVKLKEFIIGKYPYFQQKPNAWKECLTDVNKNVQNILEGLYI